MILKDLIEMLERCPKKDIVKNGFGYPHSYRGVFYELAFEPMENVTIGSMLKAAKSAVGKTFEGWKGGNFRMELHTECWLANIGEYGESIGPRLLQYMINDLVTDT